MCKIEAPEVERYLLELVDAGEYVPCADLEAVKDALACEGDEGFGPSGYILYEVSAKQPVFVEEDNKKNYPCAKEPQRRADCSECLEERVPGCDNVDEWPYDSEWDYIGHFEMADKTS